jgi:tetratricopeptide (TPR) repeat protein
VKATAKLIVLKGTNILKTNQKSVGWMLIFALSLFVTGTFVSPAAAQIIPEAKVMGSQASPSVDPEAAAMADSDFNAYKKSRYASGKYNDLVKEGIAAYHLGNLEGAHQNLFKAFNLGCESPIVAFMLALVSEASGSYYSAIDFYQLARKGFDVANQDHRFNAMYFENYGRALYYSGRIEQARPVLNKAAKKTKSFWLLKLMGLLAVEKGDTLNAVAYFERAVRINSTDVTKAELVDIYINLARLFTSQNEPEGAKRYYYQVNQLDPNNAEASRYLGGNQKQGNSNDMKAQLQKLIEE